MSYPWNQYTWAKNREKLERAVSQLEKEILDGKRKKYTEKEVKALYTVFGGALVA